MGRGRTLRSAIVSRFHAPRVSLARPDLIVFADDWGRHPSSAQHLVRHLLSDFTVTWVNTIGTRAPKLSTAAIGRGLQKLLDWSGASRGHSDAALAPQLCSPFMYPGFRSRWQRRINADLLARFLRSRFNNLTETAILSTVPIVADLPERVHARRWIYYCVDDFSAWPGLDCGALRSMEQKFVSRADRIVAAGDNLSARMRSLGRHCQVISHGIDLEHWRGNPRPASLLSGLQRPLALFWGLIDRRLDVRALHALDQSMASGGTIVLIGPLQDPDPALDRLAHLRRLGPKPYQDLPALAAAADVLIMPYADLPVTRAMQPLKLKEYLATGRPVVSTRLPAVAGWGDCLDVADDPTEFAAAVVRRSHSQLPEAQSAARKRLQAETWKSKAADLVEVLFGE
jgi:glycosyltransferase involved in cell wall biosynthesis